MKVVAVAAKLPEWAKSPLRRLRNSVRAVLYYGKRRFCPVCGKSFRRFRSFGVVPREDARCVCCGALERHRLSWIYILRKTNLFDGKPKTMLHVAPERCFESLFRQCIGSNYITAGLSNPSVMVHIDITNIPFPERSFDVIYCSHVLEHVHDDRKAMREFCRILKTNGWAILLVPITDEETFEDPSITEPEERLKAFGREGHVRRYGPDYIDRLREAGFTVQTIKANDLVDSDEAERMGLTAASGEIYYCTKLTAAA